MSESEERRRLDVLTDDLRRSIERLDKVIEGSATSKNKSFVNAASSPLAAKKKKVARPKTKPPPIATPQKQLPPQSPAKRKPLLEEVSDMASIRSVPVRKKIETGKAPASIVRNSSAHSLGAAAAKKQLPPPSPKKEPAPVLNYQRSKSARPARKSLITKKRPESEYNKSNFDSQSRQSMVTGYSISGGDTKTKRAEGRLDALIASFDFDVFQSIHADPASFRVFQRFCLLLLILHGELERVSQDKSDEFLKQLNVYSEVVNVKTTLALAKYQLQELQSLKVPDSNKLQLFINAVVEYALASRKPDDTQSMRSQATARTAYVPVLSKPHKRKLSDSKSASGLPRKTAKSDSGKKFIREALEEPLLQTPKTVHPRNLDTSTFSGQCEETMVKMRHSDFPKEDVSKETKMACVQEAFELIREDLNEQEQLGKYLFRVVHCAGVPVSARESSPLRQKHIDLYDLMDVELRMIRQQKSLESEAKPVELDAEGPRSKAFEHLEAESQSARKIDMEIVDRIKRCRSRDAKPE